MYLKQQPKGLVYEKVEVYLVFVQSKTYGKARPTYKARIEATSQQDADWLAKFKFGKLAYAELNCTVNQERYEREGILVP